MRVKASLGKKAVSCVELTTNWSMLRKERCFRLTMTLDKLKQFRSGVYTILGNAKDALFDLMDAVLVTRSVYSFVELSLSPVFRRQWSSIYEALEDSNPPREELIKLYIKQLTQTEQIVYFPRV